MYFADFHVHSKYARAVSHKMILPDIARGAAQKGLALLGTGDFTHPQWYAHLKNNLARDDNGFYELKNPPAGAEHVRFLPTVEVATFYSTGTGRAGVKKVHHVIHVESLEHAAQLNDVYAALGNLRADGRPMLGNCSPARFAEITLQAVPNALIVPSHAWTPWFGVFGSNGGFNSLDEAYEDQARHIYAIETGMSSDPAMNWRVSALDKIALLSNSDAHSPHPWRIGRECNALADDVQGYGDFVDAVRKKDAKRLLYTVEVDPAYGKYHLDGHRNCKVSLEPAQTKKAGGKCPVCKRPVTIGVLNRVEELADRPEGFTPKNAIPFKTLLPLHELYAALYKTAVFSKKVGVEADKLLHAFGSELHVLLDAPVEKIRDLAGDKIAALVALNRVGSIPVKPGFDGEYGVPQLNADFKRDVTKLTRGQKELGEFSPT